MKRMRLMGVAAFVIAGMISGGAMAADDTVLSGWASAPVRIDGAVEDWADADFYTEEKYGVDYAFKNDDKNLYIFFIFRDPQFLSSIDMTGMKVFYNLDGKKRKNIGLHFSRKQVPAEEIVARMEKEGDVLTEQQKAEMMAKKMFMLYDAEVISAKRQVATGGQDDSQPPNFRYARGQDKSVAYEFRIPLSQAEHAGGLGVQPGQALTLGFEWGGTTPEIQKAMMARRAEASSRASGAATSMEGTMRDGEARAGDSSAGGFQAGPKRYNFFVDIKLAAKQ
ncbi:MAG: hypothetical protein SCM96_02515 [Acidobacteriota bacterium]|nr:hypothetical protein [Acidobacteriota bacterium]